MIQPTDSLSQPSTSQTAVQTTDGGHAAHRTPEQTLSRLQKTAAPQQQDSAPGAAKKYREIDWSTRENPLRTPQLQADVQDTLALDRPMYYSKSLVQKDSIYRPECTVQRPGVAGDPIPYSFAADDLIISVLLGCCIFSAIAIFKSGNFIARQLRNFFRPIREGTTEIHETGEELHFQLLMVLQTALMAAMVAYISIQLFSSARIAEADYALIGIFTAVMVGYFLLKAFLYRLVGWVFFDRKRNEQWIKSALFLISSEGIALLLAVVLLIFFDLSPKIAIIYTAAIIAIVKILSFYKSHIIFFKKDKAYLQSFLYFCALELMPLVSLWGLLAQKDNFI